MKKVITLIVAFTLMMPVLVAPVFAAGSAKDVGNKFCPVSGDPVSGTSFVEYQGKRYGLCCPMCEKPFLADPAKYIAQMEAKEKASASTVKPASGAAASREMEKDMEQGSL